MRVEIRHRDEGKWTKRHFIDVLVELSEVEKRIVNIRGLHATVLDLSPGFLASSMLAVPRWVSTLLFVCTPLMFLVGCVGSCTKALITKQDTPGFGILAFTAMALFAFAIYVRIRSGQLTQSIAILDIIGEPRFAIYVPNPAYMRDVEMLFKQRVYELKDILDNAAETPMEVIEL
jgi:hypothetical protein